MKKGRILILGLAVLAAASVGATWASWVSYVRAGNEYMIPRYRTSLEEQFQGPDNWQPGITTEKKVWVSNNLAGEDGTLESAVPVIARVELKQRWVRRENVYATSSDGQRVPVLPEAGEELPRTFKDENGVTQYAAVLGFNRDSVAVLSSGMAEDPGLRLGLPYADTPDEAAGKWLLADEEPRETGNFVLYYMDVLQPGEDSPAFLETVTMNPLLENTIVSKDTWYEKTEDGYKKVTETGVNSRYGYDACRYTMDIRATTVQATKAAVEHTFDNGFDGEIIYYLANEVADPAVYDASGLEKRLTVVRNGGNGSLSYVPYRTQEGKEDGNWFMSFTDMLPGGVYRDSLKVENQSGKSVSLWMRVDPREDQEAVKKELLDQIDMKVNFKGQAIYEGKASGAGLGEDPGLQELIPLCVLAPGETETVQVELLVNPDIACAPETGACRFADQLSKIDWEFMAEGSGDSGGGGSDGGGSGGGKSSGKDGEITMITDSEVPLAVIPENPVPLAPLPKTGDPFRLAAAAASAAVSLILMAATGAAWKRPAKREKKEGR